MRADTSHDRYVRVVLVTLYSVLCSRPLVSAKPTSHIHFHNMAECTTTRARPTHYPVMSLKGRARCLSAFQPNSVHFLAC